MSPEPRSAARPSVVVLAGARTPMAEYNGAFAGVSALELGAVAVREALSRSGVAPRDVGHVVMGNALQTSGDAAYGARHVALRAGLPVEVPALTVNRLCGSGLEAIVTAARMLAAGEHAVAVAGGMENMSQAPHVIRGARLGFRLGQGALEDSLSVALRDSFCGMSMAETAEKLARENTISREEQDAYALRSQQAAAAATARGVFREEIVPVTVGSGRKAAVVESDDHPRPDTTLEVLAKLPPAFGPGGMVTAGNASGIVDGAAAVVLATEAEAARRGVRPLGRIVSAAVTGVDPTIMGIGPVPAMRQAVASAGLSVQDLHVVELNEAFAGQYLACEKALGLPRDRMNVNGGAIALGHPLGATGARLALTLLLELRRRGTRYGAASACIGGGQGIAVVFEAT